MSLAALLYVRELFRSRVRRRQARLERRERAVPSPRPAARFSLESLEPRVLLSATPAEVQSAPQPLEPAAVAVPQGNLPSLDVDLNGQADALTDGILIIRYLVGFTGTALTNGAVDPAGQRTDPAAIEQYLASINNVLDVDLNGQADSLSDGILILRSLVGFTDSVLTSSVVDPAGLRTDPAAIESYLDSMNPQRETVAPLITAWLQQDTGLSSTDAITFNPAVTGSIADLNQIVSFKAGFDSMSDDSFVEVLADLEPTGTFTLSGARLHELAGGMLIDGAHTLHLRVTDARGNLSATDLVFTLDTLAPAVSWTAELADVDPATPGTQVLEGTIIPIQPAVTDDTQIGAVDLLVNGQIVQSNEVFPFDLSVTASALTPGSSSLPTAPGGGAYTTGFDQTENPLSEGGVWLNGQTDGIDWLDIRTEDGVAYGTRVGGLGDVIDPTAILVGTWGQNQAVEAEVVVNVGGAAKEIELRLNSSLAPHSSTGYEILYEVAGTIAIVRWDGPIGSHVFLAAAQNLSRALVTGDVLKATNVDGVITAYFNGEPVAQVVDTTYVAGGPGIGLNNYGTATDPTDFGLSSFSARSLFTGTALQLRATDVAGNAALSAPSFFSVVPDPSSSITAPSALSSVLAASDPGVMALSLPSEVIVDALVTPAGETAAASERWMSLSGLPMNPRGRAFDGRGMTAVVIDTGIDLDHSFFGPDADQNGIADRIVYQWDFADNDPDASDRNGHGSHIASLIGSEDPTYPGVAPEVDLIALKVFKDSGAGNFGYVEQALQWVVAHAADYHIDVVNMSLGDGQNWSLPGGHYGIGDELASLANEGVLVIAAAGNNFFTARSQPGVAYPAADPHVIGVGAVWTQDFGGPWRWSSGAVDFTTGPDRIASFSQRDPAMTEVFAPGARLIGANQSGGTVTMQGTSQAAAYLSGTAILAQQRAEKELGRRLTPEEFVHLTAQTGKPIIDGDDENDNVTNTGATFARVDLAALRKGLHRFAEHEREEVGRHHREHGFALAYAQRCWVTEFVDGTSTGAMNREDELLITLPG